MAKRAHSTGVRLPNRRRLLITATVALLVATASACGDDDDDSSAPASDAASATAAPVTEAPADTATPETDGPADSATPADPYAELCAVAEELANQEDFPTAEQLSTYQELAPPEIEDAANIAAPALMAVEGDPVALFNAFAVDEVETAIAELNVWETENCGIDHTGEPGSELSGGATREIEDDAARVDVVATDFAFALGGDAIAPGRTSLVLTNEGNEAHFMLLMKLADGVTMDEVMSAEEGEGLVEGTWDSNLAAAGGDDEEALTVDLEAGTYGLACFVAGVDGTPHAFMGMTSEFTVG